MYRWGAVVIVTPPGVSPTSVGSAWVEDQAGSSRVWLYWRTAAQSAVGACVCGGVKWNPLTGQSPSLPTQNSGGEGEQTKSQGEEGWVGLL